MIDARATDPAAVREAVARVRDPELPELTIDDLGILRDVRVNDAGRVEVDITPTYSGCPAMEVIRRDVEAALREVGVEDAAVRTVLAPAWTTDWLSDAGRARLRSVGIAPPARVACPTADGDGSLPGHADASVECPLCGSQRTRETSRFGSTPCRALRTCPDCREPFDHMKPH